MAQTFTTQKKPKYQTIDAYGMHHPGYDSFSVFLIFVIGGEVNLTLSHSDRSETIRVYVCATQSDLCVVMNVNK